MFISPASFADIPALLLLVNGAFRGDSARRGWTHEADLLEGTLRTDEATLRELLGTPGAVILKIENETGRLLQGCVYLHKQESGLYLGMLTVAPEWQAKGIGKKLLAAAEEYAQREHCRRIFMRVLSERKELIAWYERHGYRLTGETQPYAMDAKFGIPTRPLEFEILEKVL
ncbi:MAG: GNAT family N-acetyltransferase [Saprospiraceae bacterium]